MNDPTTRAVRDYYEQNTRIFLRFGSHKRVQAIHRSLWPAGVTDLGQALAVSNRLVQAEIEAAPADSAVFADLGCGVGATLLDLLARLPAPASAIGLTISPLQARLAAQAARRAGLAGRAAFVEASFLAAPLAACLRAAYAIEAFVHAADPPAFFHEAARLLLPGGRLILIDDFLPSETPPASPVQRLYLRAYRQGWRTPGLSALADVRRMAGAAGLSLLREQDLSGWLRLRTLPAAVSRRLLALNPRHAFLASMLGSLALQHCLREGLLTYRLLVFEKRA